MRAIAALSVLCAVTLSPALPARAQDSWSDPFHGVRHLHRITGEQNLHVLVVDLCAAGVSLRATADHERRRTVSSFGELVGAQAAINGDFFSYEDYSTDGPSVSGGVQWSGADHGYTAPIAFGPRRVGFPAHEVEGAPLEPWMREIVSGHPSMLIGGVYRDNDPDPLCSNRHPRTALGLSADRRTLIMAVVDGRATGRLGMTCGELAGLLAEFGAHDAVNLDGGGSSTMWLAGAGVVNRPSGGSERVTANHLALYATGAGEGAHCPNARPEGWLDTASCDGIRGWARDPDAPDVPIDVHVYVGGPAGEPAAIAGYPIRAGNHREDLCAAIGSCAHGFDLPVPHGLMDGIERPIFAYGIDGMGGENPLLAGAPQMLRCDRPPLGYDARAGVLRHVTSPESLAAWQFDPHDIITLSDAELAAYERGADLPHSPRLIRTDGDPKVYLADDPLRRHVPDPAAMSAWRFSFDAIELLAPADLGVLAEGPPLAARPWLVRASGPEVFLLDADPTPAVEAPDAGPGAPGRDGSVSRHTDPHPDAHLTGTCSTGGTRPAAAWPAIVLVLVVAGLRARQLRNRSNGSISSPDFSKSAPTPSTNGFASPGVAASEASGSGRSINRATSPIANPSGATASSSSHAIGTATLARARARKE